jgi:hypothetical protein
MHPADFSTRTTCSSTWWKKGEDDDVWLSELLLRARGMSAAAGEEEL